MNVAPDRGSGLPLWVRRRATEPTWTWSEGWSFELPDEPLPADEGGRRGRPARRRRHRRRPGEARGTISALAPRAGRAVLAGVARVLADVIVGIGLLLRGVVAWVLGVGWALLRLAAAAARVVAGPVACAFRAVSPQARFVVPVLAAVTIGVVVAAPQTSTSDGARGQLGSSPAARGQPQAAASPLSLSSTLQVSARVHGARTSPPTTGGIPGRYLHIYEHVAREYGLQWNVLAAVGQIESDHGRSPLPGVKRGVNFAGAAGPAQFLGSTWARYGVDVHGHGKPNPYDPADAITAMAAYLKANGAPQDWRQALYSYNHSWGYVGAVLSLSRRLASELHSTIGDEF